MGDRPAETSWWARSVGRGPTLLLAAAVLAAPAWLMADTLRTFALFGDDFLYLADARDWPTLTAHLLEPHNTHVVPLFRLWTYGLNLVAWSQAAWPTVFGAASYLGLVAAMLAVGHLVAYETRRAALGLAAMALLGISTTIEPAVEWYAAGQALWSGTAVLVALIAAQSWRIEGGAVRLTLALLATLLAPTLWSGGLAAGPTTAAYLACDPRPGRRRVAWLFLVAMAVSAALILLAARGTMAETEIIWEEHRELWPRPVQALLHTAQAIPEALVGHNLGLDTTTEEGQGLVLTLALVFAWGWNRRRGGFRPNALEASGAVLLGFSYGMAYFFRGNLPFSSLREVQWYHAVPHLGAVLFVLGWWTGHPAPAPGRPDLPTRRETVLLVTLAGALLLLHRPLYQRETIAEAASPRFVVDPDALPAAVSTYSEAVERAAGHAARQRAALDRLQRAEARAAREGIGRETLRAAIGHVTVPGMPDDREAYHALDLLSLPDRGSLNDPDVIRDQLGPLLRPEAIVDSSTGR